MSAADAEFFCPGESAVWVLEIIPGMCDNIMIKAIPRKDSTADEPVSRQTDFVRSCIRENGRIVFLHMLFVRHALDNNARQKGGS